jgi:hypothetical protein
MAAVPKPMNPSSTPRDLILALLHGQDFNAVAPFVRSLKRSGYAGRLVMFTSRVGADTDAELRRQGVQVMPFHFSGKRDRQPLARLWPLWRWYFASGASAAAKARLAHRVLHVRYLRYLLYAEHLRQHAADYDRVLLADSTDIFFQADPFAWEWSPGVHFFLEEAKNRLGTCRLHRLWLGCQFGPEFVERYAQEIVSCSGTTYGDTADIREYLDLMVATTMRARNLAKISGGDQGIHNYLRLEKKVGRLTVHANRHGPVMTMGVMQAGDYQLNQAGLVLNEDGSVPPVLHQYDRLPELKKRLQKGLLNDGFTSRPI